MRLLRAAGEARHGETDELESTARTLTLEWIVEAHPTLGIARVSV